MNIRHVYFIVFIILVVIATSFSQTGINKEDYLKVIQEAEEKIWQIYQDSYQTWQNSDPSMRAEIPPQPNVYWGKMAGLLYVVTGERRYAERARQILVESPYYENYVVTRIIKQIEKSGILSNDDFKVVENKIVEAANRAVKYWVEWGAMNHCTNHVVNSLSAAINYMPNHPDVEKWRQKLDINVSANWGLWSIEDSQNYIPPWLVPMMQYAEKMKREDEFYAMPMTKYYFDYAVQLMTPDGQIVKFGDGGESGDYTWFWYLPMLEKGASVYRDGKMKWAAHRIFQSNLFEKGQAYIYTMNYLVDAYLWADDSIPEQVPTDGSRLVLEDYVGKKVVFRSGWDPKATYLFLNFLEDAPFGVDGKEHIINTINVETEKNHHGQADENAICSLMKDGSVLLHDAGYRETFGTGPDGQFRADTYHNKLIVRNGLAGSQMRLLPFLLDGGQYRFVDTKLMHFRRFKKVDISRTRLTDVQRGYQWDRVISYLKGKEWFVIFDIVKMIKEGPFTLANLLYTQDIVDFDLKDRSWFDTKYRTVATSWQSGGFASKASSLLLNPSNSIYTNQDDVRLLMYFPESNQYRQGAEQIRRCYQTEYAVYSSKADSFTCGDILVFSTILIPHSTKTDAKDIVSSLSNMEIYNTDRGYGVRIPEKDGYIQINAMLDLEAEYLKENLRPRYNFESGRAEYGDLVTDARYCYLHRRGKNLLYSFFKASKLDLSGETIFQAEGQVFGQDDGSYRRWGVSKWVAWEDEVEIKQ